MGTSWNHLPVILLLSVILREVTGVTQTDASTLYRGKYIGGLTARAHKVSGEVYAVDSRTLHIRNFMYAGSGPDAFFWVGFTEHPSPQGIIVPNEKGTKDVLGAYNMEDITLTLPTGLTLRDIKWFGVWCRAYEVNFGDLYIPPDLDYPQPHVIGSLSGQHSVSSGPIVIIDSSTILVPDFSYDGQGPSVHFLVGKGKPGPEGHKLADETGSEAPLKKSDKKTMVLSLPTGLTIFDIDYLSIWCEVYFVDFGHVKIPRNLNVPPSLSMLGVTPQLVDAQLPALLGSESEVPTRVSEQSPVRPQPPHRPLPHGPNRPQAQKKQRAQAVHQHRNRVVQEGKERDQRLEPKATLVKDGKSGRKVWEAPRQASPQSQNLVYSLPQGPSPKEPLTPPARPDQGPGSAGRLGRNGFSSITIRTSRGNSTSISLY